MLLISKRENGARRPATRRRHGTLLVECAVVLPIFLTVVMVIILGCLGAYYSEQVAELAREASRYAAVHGGKYAKDTGNPAATSQTLLNNIVTPGGIGMNPGSFGCTLAWNTDNFPYHVVGNIGTKVTNTVTVTVTYQWLSGYQFFGGITFSSTSVSPVYY